jgi:hypothetical protein
LFKSKTIFIGKKFNVQAMVVNADSDMVVTSHPLSSILVEVVVLNGHFGSDGHNNWVEEEFNREVLSGRDGRGPLLMGKRVIKLINGTGRLCDVWFTDNSSWTRSKKFRLGLRVFPGQNTQGRVLEAISEAFAVRDSRCERKNMSQICALAYCALYVIPIFFWLFKYKIHVFAFNSNRSTPTI